MSHFKIDKYHPDTDLEGKLSMTCFSCKIPLIVSNKRIENKYYFLYKGKIHKKLRLDFSQELKPNTSVNYLCILCGKDI